ncbi:MAG: Gfo/Idh/MocA family oxidoreductase [Acidobacteriota bacterium]|nr:Gfo/Idh/MocA family oxidoreductase [Acidobacteriota bacterium]
MAAEIGVAVVGFGLGGRVFHAPFVAAVPGLRLEAIVQRKGDEAAQAYPNTRILRSYEEALADPAVQLIVITTPNEAHFRMAKAALEAGKHVVIDKPITATSQQARELIDLATARGLQLFPFHNRRWDGDFLTVQQVLATGQLGRLVTFESHFDRFRPVQRAGTWKEAGDDANGMLFDLGPHLVDQCLALFGAPATITASVRRDRDSTAIEDGFDITLGYTIAGRQLLAHCRTTWLACDASPRFLLHGTHGSFKKYGLDPQEPALVHGAKVPPMGSGDTWLEENASDWGTLTTAPDPADPAMLIKREVPTARGDYRGFYANVRDTVLGTAAQAVTAEDGYRVIKLLEMARVSSAEGRTLPVEF